MIHILRTKRLQKRPRRNIAAPDIRLERLPPLLRIGIHITDWGQRSEIPRIMHEDVDTPTIGTGCLQRLKRGGHGGLVEDVGGEGEDLRGGGLGFDGGGDGGEGGRGAPGYTDYGRARQGQSVSNAVPDAAAAAGDHDGLSGEGEVREGGGDGWVG